MSVSVAMVPLLPKTKINVKSIAAEMVENWPTLPKPVPEKANSDQLSIKLGDILVLGQIVPAPIPWGDLDGLCRNSWLWPKAKPTLEQTTGHLIITAMGDDDPVERAKALTCVIAGLLATCPQAPGVYWGDAGMVIVSGLFQDMAKEMLPDALPLYLWVNFVCGTNDDDRTFGFTQGLAAFDHREFECDNSTDDVGDFRERLFSLANYVIENGPVIKDGDTVGGDEREKIKVTYTDSLFGTDGEVMRLKFHSVKKRR